MTPSPPRFYSLILIITLAKLLMNTARRMAYPFAPAFARGLGVELATITSIIALNQATAVLGPVGRPLPIGTATAASFWFLW